MYSADKVIQETVLDSIPQFIYLFIRPMVHSTYKLDKSTKEHKNDKTLWEKHGSKHIEQCQLMNVFFPKTIFMHAIVVLYQRSNEYDEGFSRFEQEWMLMKGLLLEYLELSQQRPHISWDPLHEVGFCHHLCNNTTKHSMNAAQTAITVMIHKSHTPSTWTNKPQMAVLWSNEVKVTCYFT